MQTEDESEYEHLQQHKILEHHEMLSLSSSFYFNFWYSIPVAFPFLNPRKIKKRPQKTAGNTWRLTEFTCHTTTT